MVLKLKTYTDGSKSALLGQLGSMLICNLLFLQFVFIKSDYWQDQIQLVLITWPVAAGGCFQASKSSVISPWSVQEN